METKIDEIAEGIYRLSTHVPEVAPPAGFGFNQFLIDADEPLLYHTGPRGFFPLVSEAVGKIVPVERLRWITFSHVESDECGAMNLFLDAAPRAEVAHGALGCMVSLNDLADRPPRALGDGEMVELGGDRRVRHLDTPHAPHNWEARVLFEESTRTLFAGDLLTHVGDGPAVVDDDAVIGRIVESEEIFHAVSSIGQTGSTLRRLAELEPTTVASMHGSSFRGDGGALLRDLADGLEARFGQEAPVVAPAGG